MTDQRRSGVTASGSSTISLYPVLCGFYRSKSGLILSLASNELRPNARGYVTGIAWRGELVYCASDDAVIVTTGGAAFEPVLTPEPTELRSCVQSAAQFVLAQDFDMAALVLWLLRCAASRHDAHTEIDGGAVVPMMREEIAWATNLSRESVTRCVKILSAKGLVRVHGRHLMITDKGIGNCV